MSEKNNLAYIILHDMYKKRRRMKYLQLINQVIYSEKLTHLISKLAQEILYHMSELHMIGYKTKDFENLLPL